MDASAHFSDPDGNELTYAASSSDATVAAVATEGAIVTVVAVASGNATVTVTATDPGELFVSQQFGVTVREPNRAPEATDTIPAQTPVAEGTIDEQTLVVGAEATVDATAQLQRPRRRRTHLRRLAAPTPPWRPSRPRAPW